MTRRDTIIAAVLVNAGLLIILFASALKSDAQEKDLSARAPHPRESIKEQIPVKQNRGVQGDEVDQVLKQYAHSTLSALPGIQPVLEEAPLPFKDAPTGLKTGVVPEIVAQSPTSLSPSQTLLPRSIGIAASIDYKVKRGDVLEKIARHHHCSVDEIMKLNQLSSANLRIGQLLKVPSKSSPSDTALVVSAPQQEADGSAKHYIVKNGDNPWTIALKNHMKVEDLLKLNNLDQEKARKLKPGDQLRIN